MKKKKAQPMPKKESALDKQVMRGDAFTIADAKKFIEDATKKRSDWLNIAERSWNEIEKRNKKGRLYGGSDLERNRRWVRYPLWWSCWKIRQPITLARLPIPVLKDTQGDDPYGRTACVIGERLTRGILKTFDAFPEFSAANDDFLITNFGWGRVFYKKEECVEDEKVRLQVIEQPPMLDEAGQPVQEMPPIYLTPEGKQVDPSQILDDEFGPYLLTGQKVEIENEEVFFEAGLYSNLYVDPDAKRWNEVQRIAIEYQYSYREFQKKFGKAALDKIAQEDLEMHRSGKPIITFEYHDDFLKEVYWFAENGDDFFQPEGIAITSNLEEVKPIKEEDGEEEDSDETYDNSDLYGLSRFFPCSEPLIINNSTREFWPIPEYFQVQDILDDIHSIFSRMVLLTKAIRVRFLFDSSVTELKSLIGETGEGGGLGIPNLESALMNGKGDLRNLVTYFPVKEMIDGLQQMYVAFNQRLDVFYKLIGINDLIQGATSDQDKTFGERQLEGKFALNRFEPFQRKIQEWIKNNYQLLMEMALKMFSDKSLDEYITPQTLDQEDKERYLAALELLKNNKRSRFRVDFETDSTVNINEMWQRKQAIETANVITKMQESIAKTAQEMPELAESQLKIMQHVIGELSNGKLFLDEITESIQEVIDKVKEPKEEAPDVNLMKIQLETQKMQAGLQTTRAEFQFEQMKLQSSQQLELAKLQAKASQDNIQNQLEQFKLSLEQGMSEQEIQLAVTKLQSDIALAQEELGLKREALIAQVNAEVGSKNIEEFRTMIDARVKQQEMTLAEADQALRAFEVQIGAKDAHASLQERIATEQRLQKQDLREDEAHQIDAMAKLADSMKVEPPKAAPVTIDLSKTVHVKAPEKKKEPKKK